MKDLTSLFDCRSAEAGWDSGIVFAQRPLTSLGKLHSAPNIDEGEVYRLANRATIRQEWFGCIVQNRDALTIRAFDEPVLSILRSLPLSGAEIRSRIPDGDGMKVINSLLEDGTLITADGIPSARFVANPVISEGVFSAPIAIEFELTRRCQRFCSYCAYRSGPNVDTSNELSKSHWESIFRAACEAGCLTAEFTGGDPFSRDDFLELLELFDSLGILYSINSDLTTLPDEKIARVADLENLVCIQTTLDGHNPEVHDTARGKGSFERTIESVKRLHAAGLIVSAGMIIARNNYRFVSEVVDLCRSLDIGQLYVYPRYPAGRGLDKVEDICSNNELSIASQQYADAVFSGQIMPARPSFWNNEKQFRSNPNGFNHLSDHVYLAAAGITSLRVGVNGDCYTSIKLEGTPHFIIGNVLEQSLLELWQSSASLNFLRGESFKENGDSLRYVDVRNLREQGALNNT